MAIKNDTHRLHELIAKLDEAVKIQEVSGCCYAVKDVLHDIVATGQDFIPEEAMQPAPDKYARRLIHKDPAGKYSLLAMVWGKGQGTSLHDHAGVWCVECVYRGQIKVVSYSLQGEEGDIFNFSPETEVIAGVSDAGALIPPFDYHTIENAGETPAVTLHVYGGEMTWCHAFVPEGNHYRKETRQLSYTD